jgi:hypothetical protein
MARYYEEETLFQSAKDELLKHFSDSFVYTSAELFHKVLSNTPTADVAPKSEVERLETEVRLLTENSISAKYPCHVLCSKGLILTKSLEEYDKLLADISSEVAREIFEEIGRVVCHEYNMAQVNAYNYHIYGDNDEMVGWEKVSYLQGIKRIITLLKDIEKKYTEENK